MMIRYGTVRYGTVGMDVLGGPPSCDSQGGIAFLVYLVLAAWLVCLARQIAWLGACSVFLGFPWEVDEGTF